MSSGALVRGLAVRFPQHSSGDSGAGPVSDRLHRVILQMSIALGGGLVLVTKNSLDHKKALAASRRHRCEGMTKVMQANSLHTNSLANGGPDLWHADEVLIVLVRRQNVMAT
jgi:hypothetical protein